MKRNHTTGIILVVSLLLIAGYFARWQIAYWLFFRPSIPQAHSDVPIISDIGWWPFQDGLVISDLQVTPSKTQLYFSQPYFLLKYHIKGSVKYSKGWKPLISKAQITERILYRDKSEPHRPPLSSVDILIIPVVDVREDKNYSGGEIPFDITLE